MHTLTSIGDTARQAHPSYDAIIAYANHGLYASGRLQAVAVPGDIIELRWRAPGRPQAEEVLPVAELLPGNIAYVPRRSRIPRATSLHWRGVPEPLRAHLLLACRAFGYDVQESVPATEAPDAWRVFYSS